MDLQSLFNTLSGDAIERKVRVFVLPLTLPINNYFALFIILHAYRSL